MAHRGWAPARLACDLQVFEFFGQPQRSSAAELRSPGTIAGSTRNSHKSHQKAQEEWIGSLRGGMLHSPESTVGARSARLAVLKHAAATHVALSGFYEPTTPHQHHHQQQGTTPPASASDVLRELEAHLLHAEQKPKRLGGGWSSSEFGVRSTEDAVHVSVLRREMHALEDRLFSKGDLGQQARSARRIEELEKAEEASRGVESTLQMQLAEVTHSCWRAREELSLIHI